MADTSTLRPISSRDRAALTPQDDAAVLAQALERFRTASDAEAAERAQQLEALRFRSGDHSVAAMRGAGGEAYPAPTMTVDRQSAFLKQTVNSYRKSPAQYPCAPQIWRARRSKWRTSWRGKSGKLSKRVRSRPGLHRGARPGRRPRARLLPPRHRMGRSAQLRANVAYLPDLLALYRVRRSDEHAIQLASTCNGPSWSNASVVTCSAANTAWSPRLRHNGPARAMMSGLGRRTSR